MGRKTSRKHAFSIIFQIPFHKEFIADEIVESYFVQNGELSQGDTEFMVELVNGTLAHLNEIDAQIAGHAVGWAFERIATVDLAIMRLAIFEARYRDDVPVSVAINEAVELAKTYGSDESAAFVNGLLAQVVKETPDTAGEDL